MAWGFLWGKKGGEGGIRTREACAYTISNRAHSAGLCTPPGLEMHLLGSHGASSEPRSGI